MIRIPFRTRVAQYVLCWGLAGVMCVVPMRAQAQDAAAAKDLEQLDFANGLFQRELYEMAQDEFRKLIKIYPESAYVVEARFGIAEAEFFLNNFDLAIQSYTEFRLDFPENPKSAVALVRLGQVYFLKKEYDPALEQFGAVKTDGLEGNFKQICFFYKGKTYRAKDMNAEALVALGEAVNANAKGEYAVYAHLEAGDIYAAQKEAKKADAQYQKAYEASDDPQFKSLAAYKKGEKAFEFGQAEDSVISFRSILEQYAGEPIARDALTNLLIALFKLERYADVLAEYQKHIALAGDSAQDFDPHYYAANAAIQLAQYDQALSLLDKILAFEDLTEEQSQKILLKKLEVFVSTKKFEEAVALADKVFPDEPLAKDEIDFLRAEALYGLEQYDDALTYYQMVVDQRAGAVYFSEALYGLAHTQNALGNAEAAHDLFARYSVEGQDETKLEEALFNAILIGAQADIVDKTIEQGHRYLQTFTNPERKEKVLFLIGTIHSKAKQHAQAIEVFDRFLKEYPKSAQTLDVYFLLGYSLQILERYDEAMAYYRKVADDGSDRKLLLSALKNMAFIQTATKDNEGAKQTFDRLIMEYDDHDLDFDSYFWLAQSYQDEGKYDDVLRIMEKAKTKSDYAQHAAHTAYFMAEAYTAKKEYRKALEHYGEVLAAENSGMYSGAAYIGKGISLKQLKEYDWARGEFEAAIESNPGDNTITMRSRFEIAEIEQLRENWEEAGKFYMLVAVLYSDPEYSPKSLWMAGSMFEKSGKTKEALKIYKEFLGLYPQHALAAQVEERLQAAGAK